MQISSFNAYSNYYAAMPMQSGLSAGAASLSAESGALSGQLGELRKMIADDIKRTFNTFA